MTAMSSRGSHQGWRDVDFGTRRFYVPRNEYRIGILHWGAGPVTGRPVAPKPVAKAEPHRPQRA